MPKMAVNWCRSRNNSFDGVGNRFVVFVIGNSTRIGAGFLIVIKLSWKLKLSQILSSYKVASRKLEKIS